MAPVHPRPHRPAPAPFGSGVRRAAARVRRSAEAGMSTAEYAVGTVAAVSFAAVLIAVVRSDAVRSALTSIITNALHVS